MYEKTTENISVSVEPIYLADQSHPSEHQYFWAYRVQIRNDGKMPVCLRSRYWRITDSNGYSQEVEGDGVIGKQPILNPGESFEYTSGTPLSTPGGFMVGAYKMERDDGAAFKVDIPAFSLDSPHQAHIVH